MIKRIAPFALALTILAACVSANNEPYILLTQRDYDNHYIQGSADMCAYITTKILFDYRLPPTQENVHALALHCTNVSKGLYLQHKADSQPPATPTLEADST